MFFTWRALTSNKIIDRWHMSNHAVQLNNATIFFSQKKSISYVIISLYLSDTIRIRKPFTDIGNMHSDSHIVYADSGIGMSNSPQDTTPCKEVWYKAPRCEWYNWRSLEIVSMYRSSGQDVRKTNIFKGDTFVTRTTALYVCMMERMKQGWKEWERRQRGLRGSWNELETGKQNGNQQETDF